MTALTLLSPCKTFAEADPTPSVSASPTAPLEKVTSPTATEKRFRVGYVDIMKIAAESDAGKVAKADFEAKADLLKNRIAAKQKALEKQKAELEAKLPTYSPEQRKTKIKSYEKKVAELRTMLQKADAEMRPLQEELIKDIYSKIEAAAQTYGAANGFSVILEKRELLYLGKGIEAEDVTEFITKEVNRK
jgi:outer membrane protein